MDMYPFLWSRPLMFRILDKRDQIAISKLSSSVSLGGSLDYPFFHPPAPMAGGMPT